MKLDDVEIIFRKASLDFNKEDSLSFFSYFIYFEKRHLLPFQDLYIPQESIEMNLIDSEEITFSELKKIFNDTENDNNDKNIFQKNRKLDDNGFIAI